MPWEFPWGLSALNSQLGAKSKLELQPGILNNSWSPEIALYWSKDLTGVQQAVAVRPGCMPAPGCESQQPSLPIPQSSAALGMAPHVSVSYSLCFLATPAACFPSELHKLSCSSAFSPPHHPALTPQENSWGNLFLLCHPTPAVLMALPVQALSPSHCCLCQFCWSYTAIQCDTEVPVLWKLSEDLFLLWEGNI